MLEKICLLGYMGSGKTTVAKLLALEIPFLLKDLDNLIEEESHLSIPEIFRQKGEIYFRRTESEVLKKVLKKPSKLILSLGGGTPCYANNMDMIINNPKTTSIYLKNSIETLVERLSIEKSQRPLISHLKTTELLSDFVRKHLFERSYYYNQSTIVISCDGLTPEDIVEEIKKKLF